MVLIAEYMGRKSYEMNVETFLWNSSNNERKNICKKLINFSKHQPTVELAVIKSIILEEKYGNVSDGFNFRMKFSPIID